MTFGRSCGCTASSSLAFAWGSLWVTEYGGNEIRRFDPVDGAELGAIELDVSAWILASVDDRLWVTNRDEGTVTAIAPDGAVSAPVELPASRVRSGSWRSRAGSGSGRRPRTLVRDRPGDRQPRREPRASPPPRSPSRTTASTSGSLRRLGNAREDRGAGTDPSPSRDATPLAPGRYAYEGFGPSLKLRDRPRWAGGTFADVLRRGAARRTVLRDRGRFMHPDSVIGSEGKRPAEGLSPREALAILSSNLEVAAGPITRRTIDGHGRTRSSSAPNVARSSSAPPTAATFPDPGRHRFLALDVDDQLLVIVELIHRRPHDAAARLTEGVVESVLFDEPPLPV